MTKEQSRIDNSNFTWLVVTDLDGTLLDHNTYSFQPALAALHALGAKQIPVILCSSKTRAEIVQIRRELGNSAPYIVENGAAICEVVATEKAEDQSKADFVLGRAYVEIIPLLQQIRSETGFEFLGFNDFSVDEVVDLTGLSKESAVEAKAREFSEPLIWKDTEHNKQIFLQLLAEHRLSAQQGGRFLTVSGITDKGKAVAALREIYGGSQPLKIIALGDSPNDQAMLDSADIAVIVKSDNSDKLNVERPTKIIVTQERGPAGWNNAILQILEEYNNG